VGQPVAKCCDRYNRQRCCFEVPDGAASAGHTPRPRGKVPGRAKR
jgi:hypothetical protein